MRTADFACVAKTFIPAHASRADGLPVLAQAGARGWVRGVDDYPLAPKPHDELALAQVGLAHVFELGAVDGAALCVPIGRPRGAGVAVVERGRAGKRPLAGRLPLTPS